MAGPVFDLVWVLRALAEADEQAGSALGWRAINDDQARLLGLRGSLEAEVRRIRDLPVCVSAEAGAVERFLAQHGAGTSVAAAGAGSFAIAGALEHATVWPAAATSVPIHTADGDVHGFELAGQDVGGYPLAAGRTLVALPHRATDDRLPWLLLTDGSASLPEGMALFDAARAALTDRRAASRVSYSTATIPEARLDETAVLDWLAGMSAPDAGRTLEQATQVARVTIDRSGGAQAADTTAPRGFVGRLVVDRPFVAFWTDPGAPALPISLVLVDRRSWTDWDPERADRENHPAGEAAEAAAERQAERPGLLRRLFGRG